MAVILALLAVELLSSFHRTPAHSHDRYENMVVGLMLLFNHLAYQFRFPAPATVALRFLAWGWMVFAVFCLVWRVLFS